MGYNLKILSPVHIGCGEQLNGLNFILDGKKVYVVEPEAIIKLLGPEKGLKFAQWLEANSNEIARLDAEHWEEKKKDPKSEKTKTARKNMNNKKQNFTLRAFVDEKKLVTLEQLKSKAVYSIAAQDGVFNDNEIAPFLKQARSPYIPGTELKGATRTAILYCAMRDDAGLQGWLKGELKAFQTHHSKSLTLVANERNLGKQNPYNQRQKLSKLKESLEREMSRISYQLEEKVLTCKPDAKYDVMKFMQVGDSHLLNGASSLVVSFAQPFNMYNKFKIYYEYLRPDTLVPLTSFKLEDDKSRDIKLKKMEFTERHKHLMSGLDAVLSCCHRFAADLLAEEIAYFTQHDRAGTGIVKDLRRIENLNSLQAPVLRIGKDEGYTSLTVGLAVKKLMPELYENVLIHATKNKSYDSSVTKDGFYFPKSRKIVHWDGQELTAGWVQLIPPVSHQTTANASREKPDMAQSKPDVPIDLSRLADKFGKGKR